MVAGHMKGHWKNFNLMKRRVKSIKDVMWEKNKLFCLEIEVQGSEFSVSVSKQYKMTSK